MAARVRTTIAPVSGMTGRSVSGIDSFSGGDIVPASSGHSVTSL